MSLYFCDANHVQVFSLVSQTGDATGYTVEALDMGRFHYSGDRGFLPGQDPLVSLPDRFGELGGMRDELPTLLREGRMRSAVRELPSYGPIINGDEYDDRTLAALYRDFAISASCYMKAPNEEQTSQLPHQLAGPVVELSRHFGEPPIMKYRQYCLDNFRRVQPDGPIALGNIKLVTPLSGHPSEAFFVLNHTDIEQQAGRALFSLARGQQAVLEEDDGMLVTCLSTTRDSIDGLRRTLARQIEGNDPRVYWNVVRPLIQKFDDVVYEGEFDGEPQSYRGETGAQSSVMPFFDEAFSVAHQETGLTNHIADMRNYMPRPHRDLLDTIARGPSIREYVAERGDSVMKRTHDGCLEGMARFREQHYAWGQLYIQQQTDDPLGTGGTPYIKWLKLLIDETRQAQLGSRKAYYRAMAKARAVGRVLRRVT